jgi:hypothetical protein
MLFDTLRDFDGDIGQAAHPVSGSWRGARYVESPEAYSSLKRRETADPLTSSNLRRGSYTAT